MIKNYLKITLRTLLKHKIFSIINIFGFTISIAICLMIIIFIKDQKSSDRFNEKRDRICRIYTTDKDIKFPDVKGYATTPGSLAPYLLYNYPYIEDVVRLRQIRGSIIHKGEEISIRGLYAEPSFFNIFSYQLKAGNPNTALNEPYSVILSEETAYKFFGNEDPVNKVMTFEKLGNFTVTGILKDPGKKSHFEFNALFSFATSISLGKRDDSDKDINDWNSFENYYTYILLKDKSDRSLIKTNLAGIGSKIFPETENERYGFAVQPLLDINLGINLWYSLPGTVKSFDLVFIPILAILIIFVTCFNYIILSVSHSLKRTKEIGFNKVIGARRSDIIKLFLSETIVITFFAFISACILILWLIPAFNGLDIIENSKLQINIQQMKDPVLYIIFILFTAGIGILAGLFPALYLSSFQPIEALKNISKIRGLSHLLIRKVLIGIQFAVSIIFVIFMVYFKQLHTYFTRLDYGIKTENMVSLYVQETDPGIVRNEIISNSDITGVSLSNEIPVVGGQSVLNLRDENMEEPYPAFYYSIDPAFITFFGIDLIAGRDFSLEYATDMSDAIIINRKAVQVFNLGSPAEAIGKVLIEDNGHRYAVIGVVEDFIYTLPDEPIAPLILRYVPEEFSLINIRFVPGMKNEIKAYLEGIWEKFDKIHGSSYKFFDDAKEELEMSIGGMIQIIGWACGFVIFVSLFGLLGMAIYTTEMRIKEIGIRKVFGAGILNVVYLLSKDYINLILYSAIIAIPAAYFSAAMFYQFFAFRPELKLWVLPASLIFILILALMTISSQTVKAALKNPAETLKEE